MAARSGTYRNLAPIIEIPSIGLGKLLPGGTCARATAHARCSASTSKRRIRSRMKNIAVQKEIGERGARLGKFGMLVELMRNTFKCMQL